MNMRPIISLLLIFTSICTYAQLESKKNTTGKFGFTDETGDWIIQPIYDEVIEFYELPNTFAKLKGKWGIINQKGQTVQPFEYSKIKNLDYGDAQLYSAMKGKHFGLVSLTEAKPLTEFVYDTNFYFDDGLFYQLGIVAVVNKNNKAGLINTKGIEVIPCVYDKGKSPFTNLEDYFYLVRQNGRVGLIDTVGRQIVPCRYDNIAVSNSVDSAYDVIKNNKYGLCDFQGNEVISPRYDKPFYFEGEYAIARLKGKYGIINLNGETIKPFTYTKESDAFDDLIKLFEK
jgi:hypothetical protein